MSSIDVKCPKCGSDDLHSTVMAGAVVYDCLQCRNTFSRSMFGIESAARDATDKIKRKAWAFQFWWLGYLFRHPAVIVLILLWFVDLLLLFGIHGTPSSVVHTAVTFVVGSLLVSVAPVLTILYSRRHRHGLTFFRGWPSAIKNDSKLLMGAVATSAVALLICMNALH